MAAEELRPHLRAEQPPGGAVVVIRGGRTTVDKLRAHSVRTHKYYQLDGQPLWGVSVFCALDAQGTASLDGLLAGRMVSYPIVHLPTAGALVGAGFELLPSFDRPHYTLRLATADQGELEQLLGALGPPQRNPYHGRTRRQGGNRP